MANFGSPFGLGLGLGQALSGIPEAVMRGEQFGLQRQALDLSRQSQEMQLEEQRRSLGERAAIEDVLSKEYQPTEGESESFWTPQHKTAWELNRKAQELRNRGYGIRSQAIQQQAMDMFSQGQNQIANRAAKSLIGGLVEPAVKDLNRLGFGIRSITPSVNDLGEKGYLVQAEGADVPHWVSALGVQAMADDPSKAFPVLMQEAARASNVASRKQIQEMRGAQSLERERLRGNIAMDVQRLRNQALSGLRSGSTDPAKVREVQALKSTLVRQGLSEQEAEIQAWEKILHRGSTNAMTPEVRILKDMYTGELRTLTAFGAPDPNSPDGKRVEELRGKLEGLAESAKPRSIFSGAGLGGGVGAPPKKTSNTDDLFD